MNLYGEFIDIAKTLNKELAIVPVLYGSLGLEKVTKVDFFPQDIDILVPLIFLKENWDELQRVMEQQGYEIADLSEHEFRKNDIKIGIAYKEDLLQFADVDYRNLEVVEDYGAKYYSLTAFDYLKVYNKSMQDGYRRTKNNNKDQGKVKVLNKLVQN